MAALRQKARPKNRKGKLEMSVILGIDGGGTNTRAAIVADGKVIGSGHNGSIKRLRVGAEAAEANLRALLKDVFAKTSLSNARRLASAASAPTRSRLMEPLCPLPMTFPSATIAALVLVPPPSIPRITLISNFPFLFFGRAFCRSAAIAQRSRQDVQVPVGLRRMKAEQMRHPW